MTFETVLGDLKPMGYTIAMAGVLPLLVTDVVTLRYTTPDGVTKEKAVTVVDVGTGEVQADWIAGDLPSVGPYIGLTTVTRVGDASFPRTYPDDGSKIIWWVHRAI